MEKLPDGVHECCRKERSNTLRILEQDIETSRKQWHPNIDEDQVFKDVSRRIRRFHGYNVTD